MSFIDWLMPIPPASLFDEVVSEEEVAGGFIIEDWPLVWC